MVVALTAAAAFADMEERDALYLYDEHLFPDGKLLALSYVVPGKDIGEKGIEGVVLVINTLVINRYETQDKVMGVKEYMVAIITYPCPEKNIPSKIIQYELNSKKLEELVELIRGKKVGI
jgi:MoaA/NifB/PqqE/SkfB family radical SAM enzyme